MSPLPGLLKRRCRSSELWVRAAFAAFFLFLLASNELDWDLAYSYFEVDRRSWLLDHRLPLWSYPLCGGSTRIGDPISFGLSPLFAPVLAFGTVLGLKILIFGLAVAAFLALRRLIELILGFSPGERAKRLERAIAGSLALGFVLGDYFLDHLVVGHFPFALHYLVVALFLLYWRALERAGSRIDPALGAFLVFSLLMAGFYHTAVFFLLPLALAALFAVGTGGARWLRDLRSVVPLAAGVAAGALAAMPRLLETMRYQASVPRVLANKPVEIGTLGATLASQLFPNVGLVAFPMLNTYRRWENASFSVPALFVALVAVAAVARAGRRRILSATATAAATAEAGDSIAGDGGHAAARARANRERRALARWRTPGLRRLAATVVAVVAVGALFYAGDRAPWSLHRIVNSRLSGSIRVIGRYQIVFSFAAVLAAAGFIAVSRRARRLWVRFGLVGAPCVSIAMMASIAPRHLYPARGLRLLRLAWGETSIDPRSREVVVSPRADDLALGPDSVMYPWLARGKIVLDCYNPLGRGHYYPPVAAPLGTRPIALVFARDPAQPLADACIRDSYARSGSLHLDLSCGPGTCVRITQLRPEDAPLGLAWHPGAHAFCR